MMIITDKLKEIKMRKTVKEYQTTMNEYGGVHEKQIKFAETITDLVYNDKKEDKVNVYVARCGMGKSVIIKALLNNLANDYTYIGAEPKRKDVLSKYGAIVITDNLERLENIKSAKGLEDRCYLIKSDSLEEIELERRKEFHEKVREQFAFPVLLITTQKYFKMSEEERQFMYTWAEGKREVAFIDEKPMLTSEITIDEKFLSEISVALHRCFENEHKDYLLKTFKRIKDNLDDIRTDYANQYDTMWVKKSKESLLINIDEDEKFFKILAENVSTYTYEQVLQLKRIYAEGCLFTSKKDKFQENVRQFIVLNDNSDKFDIEKCKYHILDATAYYDMDYTINKDIFDYIEVDDKKDKNDIILHHITFNASQNTLLNHPETIDLVCDWINENCGEDVFVSTYGKKKGLYQKFSDKLETKYIAWYGAIKGKNTWEDKNTMVHIGLNRQADTVYLLTFLYIDRKNEHGFKWNEADNESILNRINELLKMKDGLFEDLAMRKIMRSKILVDTEQNIMRIKCRHFNNEEPCNIFIIAGFYYSDYMTRLAKKLNVPLLTDEPNVFKEYRILQREYEDKRETIPQKIIKWINDTWDGQEIKTKDMLEHIGISQNQFDKAKEKNSDLKEILGQYMVKRGIYKKAI